MENNKIIVIGAANIDIHGFSFEEILPKESNPGRVKFCLGGVGRNISENLARVGAKVQLISSIGGDANSQWLLAACKDMGIDMSETIVFPEMNASIYLDIMNANGDMELAVSDLVVLEMMSPEHLKKKHEALNNARVIVLDTGLREDVIYHVLDNYRHIPIFVDPVSSPKSKKIKNRLQGIHTLKLNRLEAQSLTNIMIVDDAGLNAAAAAILDEGVQRVFITLGEAGVFYREGAYSNRFRAKATEIVNTTGSGDAFMAGVVYSFINNFDLDRTARVASGFSLMTLADEYTVNPNINEINILDIISKI